MNSKNLKKVTDRTPAERHALAVKAGKASGKKRRELRETRDYMEALLSVPIKDEYEREELERGGLPDKSLNRHARMLLGLLRKAEFGDVRAIELILKIIGEYPADRQEVTISKNEGLPGQDIRISWVDNEMNEVDHDIIHCPAVPAEQVQAFKKKH